MTQENLIIQYYLGLFTRCVLGSVSGNWHASLSWWASTTLHLKNTFLNQGVIVVVLPKEMVLLFILWPRWYMEELSWGQVLIQKSQHKTFYYPQALDEAPKPTNTCQWQWKILWYRNQRMSAALFCLGLEVVLFLPFAQPFARGEKTIWSSAHDVENAKNIHAAFSMASSMKSSQQSEKETWGWIYCCGRLVSTVISQTAIANNVSL